MRLRLVWSALAVARLDEIEAYIAQDKPGAAARWALGLLDAVERLADFPASGRVVPETNRLETREITYGKYRIIYRAGSEEVLILTIRHSRRLLDPSEVQ